MLSEQSIKPLNIAAATMLIQLLLMPIIAITSSLCRSGRQEATVLRGTSERLRKSPILSVALISFATLLISDELYSIWSPIFQGIGINTISATVAISIVFILDIFLIGYLILSTGGSNTSPFVSTLFTIPAIAIFIRLPPSMFFSYAIISVILYLILHPRGSTDFEKPQQSAAIFMNIACLLLSLFTGYITRPVPINELKAVALQSKSIHSEIPTVSSVPK